MKNSYTIIIICLIGGFIWGSRSNGKKSAQPQMVENQHYDAGEVDALANQLNQMWLAEEARRNEEDARRREQANKRSDEIQRLMQKASEDLNRYQHNSNQQTTRRQWQPPERQPTYYWVCRYCGHEIFIGRIPQGRMPNPPPRGNRCLRQPTEGGFRNCVYDKVQR